jgi:hypothetical protein
MAQQTINVGTSPNDGTGTPLRTAFQYTNSNFSELYTAVGPSGNNIVVPGNATITGDLTVDTSTLKVDSANNRVGIGTAAPISLAQLSGATPTLALSDTTASSGSFFNILFRHTDGLSATYNIATIQGQTNGNGGNGNLLFLTASSNSNTEKYRIASDGVATWSNVGGVAGTAMTLNSTGLGVGVSPSQKFHVKLDQNAYTYARVENQNASSGAFAGLMLAASGNTWGIANGSTAANSNSLAFYNDAGGTNSVKMLIDGSGNVGVGVTPASNTRTHFKGSSTSTDYITFCVNGSDKLVFGARNDGLFITGNSADSASLPNAPYNLTSGSAANVYLDSQGIFYRSTSSLKYKTDIADSTRGLSDVLKLRPVTYKAKNSGDTVFGGLIAEEVDAAGLNEFVQYAPDKTPDAIHYGNMVSLLVAAIKELTARVEALEA